MITEDQLDYIINQDSFWDTYMEQNETTYEKELIKILRRHRKYSRRKLVSVKRLSNKCRISAGRKPLFPEVNRPYNK